MDDQNEVLAFLAEPASHKLAGTRIERIDTHASVVFLVGERVYKLKRALYFSYLDYSTVERRGAACRAEVALNQRTAPRLYLGVRAIRRHADGHLGFDGEGTVLDWVVEMRRFDTQSLFDRMAEAGRLSPPLMRDLADVIAAFHATAPPSRQAGGSAAIARIIEGNDANLRLPQTVLDQDAVQALHRAARETLGKVGPLLERRRQNDKVRRCHGDLHLGNVCLFEGKPTLFDAIEFSDEIATIDVVYDLAFLLMDLIQRRLGGLANLVLNRYFDLSRESEILAALPLFLSLRAAIRSHVSAAAVLRQPDPVEARRLEDVARGYLALAHALLNPAPAPRLIAIGGLSGSGKSTLAQAIAGDIPQPPGARVLRSDVLRKALLDLPPEQRLPANAYSHAMGRQVYTRLFREAAAVLATGCSVILDATFLDREARGAAAQVADNAGAAFNGIWLEAPPEVMRARLDKRQNDASDATVLVLDDQLARDPGPIGWPRIASVGNQSRVLAGMRRALGLRDVNTSNT